MKYLTGDEILAIHSEIIDATGGAHGVRDAGLFVSIIEKPKARFGGKELYKGIFMKTAVYLEAFVNYHVFIDGNKRTGIAAAARFLFLNGLELKAANKEMERFVLGVATSKPKLNMISSWFKKHCKKI